MPNLPVEIGQFQNPYREFTFTLAPSEVLPVDYAFNFFRCLSLSNTTLNVRFGGSGSFSNLVGAGIGYELPEVINKVYLQNTDGSNPITVTIALSIGKIYDDRLNVTGALNIATPTVLDTAADVAIATVDSEEVLAANSSRKEAFISNLAANGTVVRVGDSNVGASRGVELAAGGTMIITNTEAVHVYNPSGGTINIGVMESEA